MNAIHEIIYHILCGHTFRRRRRFFTFAATACCCAYDAVSSRNIQLDIFRLFFFFFSSHSLHTPLFSLLIKRHSASFSILSD